MSISSTTNRVVFAGAGTGGPFNFAYPLENLTDLKAAIQDTVLGTITPLVYTTDFTLSGTLVPNFGIQRVWVLP